MGFYLRSNVESARHEAERTDLDWPAFESAASPAAFFQSEENAVAWLYYVCLLLPIAAAGAAFATRPELPGLDAGRSRAVLLTLAVYAALLNHFLLRGNLAARFGDLGAPIAVLAAWLIALAPVPVASRYAWRSVLAVAGASVVLAMNTAESVWQELATTKLREGPLSVASRVAQVGTELGGMPPERTATAEERDRSRLKAPNVVEYLRACTAPADRLLVLADAAEVAAFAARPFAGGHPTFRSGFYVRPDDQALTIERLNRQSILGVITRDEADYREHIEPVFTQVVAWVAERYEFRGELPALTGPPMRVLIRRDMAGSERLGDTELPCPR